MTTRAKLFSQLAKSVDTTGAITSDGISSTVSLGATVYDSIGELPMSGYTAGEQAFVKSTSRLYINSGVGWYNVAVINNTPTIQSILDSDSGPGPFSLATDGTATTITITAQDSDGDALTYTASADSDFNGLATISQASNVFTITPLSQDSATTESGTITFNVTDNINIANSVQTFTLNFLSALWDETVLSVGTSSTNSLGNSTFIDRSTNAIAVTPTGSPTQTAFHPYLDYWSAEFDGSGDYLTASANSAFNFGTGDFTVEAWVNKTAGGGGIWTNGPTSSGSFGFYMQGTGELRCDYYGGTGLIGTTQIPDNVWHHVAVSRNGSDLSLYINGVRDATTTTSSNNTTSSFAIGRAWTNNPGEIAGYISNLRIIKGTAIYTGASYTTPTEPLTAISGTSALTCQSNSFVDNSSNDHTITANGTPKVSAFNPFGQESEYALGENKGSVRMIQTNTEFLVTPQLASLSSTLLANNFTIEAWVYLEEYASVGASHIWNNSQSNSDQQTALYIYPDGRIMVGKVGVNEVGSVSGTIKLNVWHHVAIVGNGATTRIYVDGADVANGASSTYLNSSNVTHMKIGRSSQTSNDNSFPGYISDFKVTPSAVYTSAFTPPTAPLGNTNASLYLPFDNAGIFDKTGNHTLTVVGDASTSTTQTKYADTAMYFDGSGDVIRTNLNEIYNIGTNDFTVEFWVYPSSWSSSNWDTIFSVGQSTNNGGLLIGKDTSENFVIRQYGTASRVSTSTLPPVNTWTHVACVRSSGTSTIYYNGTSIASAADTSNYNTTTPYAHIGNSDSTTYAHYFNGYVENLQFFAIAKYTTNFTVPSQEQGRSYQAED